MYRNRKEFKPEAYTIESIKENKLTVLLKFFIFVCVVRYRSIANFNLKKKKREVIKNICSTASVIKMKIIVILFCNGLL